MLPRTNIEKELVRSRSRRIASEAILEEVKLMLQNSTGRGAHKDVVFSSHSEEKEELTPDLLEADRIFHLQDIKKLCITYRLRFLGAQFFKGGFPEEAVTKIKILEKEHEVSLNSFKVMAPSRLLKLENADDPLLFTPLGNDYFYLIHKWGNDLHPLRKILMWPYKSFENLIFTIIIVSILLTSIMPMNLFTHTVAMQEYILLFLFMIKAVGGIVLFYGFARGKNFNSAIWNSKYYNA